MNLKNFTSWVPEILAIAKFVVSNLVHFKPLIMAKKVDPLYSTDLKIIYAKDISAMAEMLRFTSQESLEKIYLTSKEKLNAGNYELSELIVHEAVKGLLNKY